MKRNIFGCVMVVDIVVWFLKPLLTLVVSFKINHTININETTLLITTLTVIDL